MGWRWLVVGALCAGGCQVLLTPVPAPVPTAAEPGSSPIAPPEPGGDEPRTVASLPETDTAPVPDEPDAMTLAAECLQRGDQPAAADHLTAYVRAHPDQLMFRAHLAELLFQLGRLPEARDHFERFVAAAQAATGPPREHLVHCHTRLMEIGSRADDEFAKLFHRGVGLLLLVADQDADRAPGTEQTCEEILCQALRALREARELRPTDARVHLYLADAHDHAGNRRGADAARAAARHLALPGALTPSERQRLALRP